MVRHWIGSIALVTALAANGMAAPAAPAPAARAVPIAIVPAVAARPASPVALGLAPAAGVDAAAVVRVVPTAIAPTTIAPATGDPAGQEVTYRAPVTGALVVVRRFDPPLTPYGAGHRGVDLALARGGVVVAAGVGVVRFAGPVAGRGVVVVQHPDGVSTEYEPVTPLVHAGVTVQAGQPIGRLSGRHRGCAASCLHWGARRAGQYFDPLSLLRPLAPCAYSPGRTDLDAHDEAWFVADHKIHQHQQILRLTAGDSSGDSSSSATRFRPTRRS